MLKQLALTLAALVLPTSAGAAALIGTTANVSSTSFCKKYTCLYNRMDASSNQQTYAFALASGNLTYTFELTREANTVTSITLYATSTSKTPLNKASSLDLSILKELYLSFGGVVIPEKMIRRCLNHDLDQGGGITLLETPKIIATCESDRGRSGPPYTNFHVFRASY